MAKKSIKRSTKKTTLKKKTASSSKLNVKTKASPFKSKLGHDPLAWITGEDANEFGLTFDEIDSSTTDTPIPPVDVTPVPVEAIPSESVSDLANDGWGLFDDEPLIVETKAVEEEVDDTSWGLFSDEEDSVKNLPVGEGVAWGLFEENSSDNAAVDTDAIIINLPSNMNVANISAVYHDLEAVIYKNSDVIVDAGEVETLDATGLQLLFVAQKELQKRDCKLVIKDASEKIELLSTSSFINEALNMVDR